MPPEGPANTGDNEVVLGVDTHKDVHVAVVLNALGVRLAAREFPTTRPATAPCSPGRVRRGRCAGPA